MRANAMGLGVRFRFWIHHLQQWSNQLAALKTQVATNPFAAVALAQLTADTLLAWSERVLTASTLEDVIR